MKSVHFLAGSLFMLAIQSIFLTLTDNVTEILWIPCMIIAAGMMYGFLMVGGNMKPLGAAYCCARAFVMRYLTEKIHYLKKRLKKFREMTTIKLNKLRKRKKPEESEKEHEKN